jgi:hypothetical protein
VTWRVGLRPAATLLALVAMLIGASLTGATGRAEALDRPAIGAGSLSIRIVEFEPSIPAAGDTLTLRGTITNTSPEPVRAVAAALRVSVTPLANRDEIPEVLTGAGQRFGREIPGTRASVIDELAPGASQPFQLTADVTELGLASSGVYVTGAEALGDSGAGLIRQDMDRTFLPWWPPDPGVEPLLLTTVWPLTGAPLRDAEGVLLTEAAAIAMSPAGRLSRLLEAASAEPGAVSVVLDPEAVQVADDLADGYLVRSPDGDVAPGTRSREVAGWLDQLRTAVSTAGADVSGSLYAWPDIDAVRRGKLLGTVLRQQPALDAEVTDILGRRLRETLVLAPGGVAQPTTLNVLAKSPITAIVLSDRAAPLADPTYFTPSGNVLVPTGRGDLAGLLADSGLSQTLGLPMDSPAEQTAARQALLAQTLTVAGELPETQRLLVASIDPVWDPPAGAAEMVVGALAGAPWVVPTTIGEALSREPGTLPRVAVAPTAEDVAAELPSNHVARVRDQYGSLRDYASVVTDPELIPEVTRTAPTRMLGSWFRTHPATRTELMRVVDDQISGLIGSVRVVSSGSITVSGESGTIPITVDNDGTQPVTVGLVLTSKPPQLFSADPVEPFTIDPERRTSVVVTAKVAGSGPIPVTIQLVTSAGEPFGEPGLLVVESAAYANAARLLVRAAIGALLLAVVVHGVRRARRRRGSRPGAADAPTEPPDRESAGVGRD